MHLGGITLVCIDDLFPERASELLIYLNELITFESTKLLCSKFKGTFSTPISPITSGNAYSEFVIKDLHEYIDTDFCMTVQTDGFFVNPEAWTDDFLDYDYIGAPWGDGGVGNGGFSIRSKSLLEFVSNHPLSEDPKFDMHPEDAQICSAYRDDLETAGHRFAPTDIAKKFSKEGLEYIEEDVFGFHGKHTFLLNKYSQENPSFASAPKLFDIEVHPT